MKKILNLNTSKVDFCNSYHPLSKQEVVLHDSFLDDISAIGLGKARFCNLSEQLQNHVFLNDHKKELMH